MKEYFAPRISADTAPFWDGCRQHKLLLQKCGRCGHIRWPAAYLCPQCLSEEADWTPMSGRGTLYSYIVMHKAFHPSIEENVPYIVAEIDLEEGVRILSNLEPEEGQTPHCGDRVNLDWCDGQQYSKTVFRIEKE